MKLLNKIRENLFNHSIIRRCLYCQKIRFCRYYSYIHITSAKAKYECNGYLCKVCDKLPFEDIIFKRKKDIK